MIHLPLRAHHNTIAVRVCQIGKLLLQRIDRLAHHHAPSDQYADRFAKPDPACERVWCVAFWRNQRYIAQEVTNTSAPRLELCFPCNCKW